LDKKVRRLLNLANSLLMGSCMALLALTPGNKGVGIHNGTGNYGTRRQGRPVGFRVNSVLAGA
jgi:hypothetical protein